MWRLPAFVMLLSATATGQSVVDGSRLAPWMRGFDPGPEDRRLVCDVSPIPAVLDFGFRFQAGYLVEVPISQYSGKGHFWATITRVTPESGAQKPVYLTTRTRLPEIPPDRTQTRLQLSGGFLLGEGRYQVSWKLVDDTGRVCRKNWIVTARLHRSEREVKVALPPDTATDYSLRGISLPKRDTDADVARLRFTILMHAAPAITHRTRLGPRDRVMLTGTLSSLVGHLPASSVRLVVFNLDKQKELYRQDDFSPLSMNQVARAISGIQLETVDYQVLQNRTGHVDLLADLIHSEVTAAKPSDVVLFLGPLARYSDKMPAEDLDHPDGSGPRFFYLQYRPNYPQPSVVPDVISHAVARLRGKTLIIHTPGEFAKALEQLGRK